MCREQGIKRLDLKMLPDIEVFQQAEQIWRASRHWRHSVRGNLVKREIDEAITTEEPHARTGSQTTESAKPEL